MVFMIKKKLAFRAWFYFRQGWGTYFAFIIAALNTMVTTYYLAIDKVTDLKIIFPSFGVYVVFWVAIGIPLLITIGYIHFKKVPAYSSEVDVNVEANPYCFKLLPGWQTDTLFPMYLLMTKMFVKVTNNEKLDDEEISKLSKLQKDMQTLIDGGYIGNTDRFKNVS